MAGYKNGRITSDIKNALSLLFREVKDPRVSDLISIVKINLSGDCSYAAVYISAIEGFEKSKESAKGLNSAAGFLRQRLSQALKIRKVPELKFIADDSLIKSAEILETIKGFNKEQ
ncbi:MAG: 30S ribosome-binding factor RbfA [Oscillospiraceae bacterium]|nr:30S ribosome-binding factor RbfA [Candidatus Equicaccousia limihippi]